MKLLSAKQQQELDQFTIENEPISNLDLMERAGKRCADTLLKGWGHRERFAIVAGPGNNGGDGLVIARLLALADKKVSVYFVALTKTGSEAFEENRKRLKKNGVNFEILTAESDFKTIDWSGHVIVDAIFGTGLSRPAEGIALAAIERMNASEEPVIAIDVPSGMYANELHEAEDKFVMAAATLTIHAPKQNFFFPETGNAVGELYVLDIGLLEAEMGEDLTTDLYYITDHWLNKIHRKRSIFSHKGTYGHAHIVAGSEGKIGAAILSASGALKAGAGLVSVSIPKCGLTAIHAKLPEVMVEVCGEDYLQQIGFSKRYKYGVGPGLGAAEQTSEALERWLATADAPVVLDADMLNLLSRDEELIKEIPDNSILTPHPREFERLAGSFSNSYERTQLQIKFSQKYGVFVILKDARTIISTPCGHCYFSTGGNPGMATGGSGDVLTGIITGLLAQNYQPLEACVLGVGIHAMAGDCALEMESVESLTAQTIVSALGTAFRTLKTFN
ncbi:MAG: NAD(P)H-hydrate dehydratase [Bacteroidota bacterium]